MLVQKLKLTDANGQLDLVELTRIEELANDYIEVSAATGNTGSIADDISRAFVAVMPLAREALTKKGPR